MDEMIHAAEVQQNEDSAALPQQASAVYQNLTLSEAESYIEGNLVTTARAYVATGYFLKRIRNDRLYEEDGYKNFDEYVRAKYGKGKDWASRAIKVNGQLSVDGDSPYLGDEYKGYTTYQLVELAYMTEEQREQATPEQTVKELREIRKPKEILYFAMEGQLDLEADFLEAVPEEQSGSQIQIGEKIPEPLQEFAMSVEDLVGGETEKVATSQLWDKSAVQEKTGICAHRDGFPCSLAEQDKQTPGDGEDCTHKCCWGCVKHGCCSLECYASAQRPENAAETQQEAEKTVAAGQEPDDNVIDLDENVIDPEEDVIDPEEDVIDPEENAIDAEYTEVPEKEEYTPQYFLQEQREKMDEMLEVFKDEDPEKLPKKMIARQKIIVAALASMVCELENAELEEQMQWPRAEQPDLPKMQNNDQRKAFLDTFHEWPVWFCVPEASEVYYRYDLPDRTALVICEYHYWLEWKLRYSEDPEGVSTREYLLTPGYHYLRDCPSNRSAMVEKLKEIQKRG